MKKLKFATSAVLLAVSVATVLTPLSSRAATVETTLKDNLTGRSTVVTKVDLSGLVTTEELADAMNNLPEMQKAALDGKADIVTDLYVQGAATNSFWVCDWGERKRFDWYAEPASPHRSIWGIDYEGLTYFHDSGEWLIHVYFAETSVFEKKIAAPYESDTLDFGGGFSITRNWLYETNRVDNTVIYSNELAVVRAEAARLEADKLDKAGGAVAGDLDVAGSLTVPSGGFKAGVITVTDSAVSNTAAGLSWTLPTETGKIALTDDISSTVTTEFVQGRLGVYLYMGDDGHCYVHVPEAGGGGGGGE